MLAESTNSSLNGCVSSQQWTKTETETFTFLEIKLSRNYIKQNIKKLFISFNFQGNICHFNLVELDHLKQLKLKFMKLCRQTKTTENDKNTTKLLKCN